MPRIHSKFVCSIIRRVDFVHLLIVREPVVAHNNDQRLTNLSGSAMYTTLTIPDTNALCKFCTINYQILSFCINTFRVAKDSMMGVNSYVVLCV